MKGLMILILVFLAGCASHPVPEPVTLPPAAPSATANVREVSRVTHDATAEWAPRINSDGTILLFTVLDFSKKTWGEASSIASVTIGRAGRKLIAGPYAAQPAWYPDGKHLVYQYKKPAQPTLVRQPFGGLGMTFITPHAMGSIDNQPDVNPTGEKIAFSTKLGGSLSVCTVDTDGSDFTVYVDGSSPRWHPSKNIMIFENMVAEYSHIFLLDMDSGQVTQLTMGNTLNSFPSWSPDGEWVCFVSNRDGKYHIYAMKDDGSSLSQLTSGESQEFCPEWGPDNVIYFISDAGASLNQAASPWDWRYSDIWKLTPILPD